MKKLIIGAIAVAVIAGVVIFTLKKGDEEGLSITSALSGNSGNRFEKLLAYVPNDTSYLFGNKNAVPEDYADMQMNRVEKLIDALKEMVEEESSNKSSNDIDFISSYYKHFTKSYKDNNLKSMGYEKGQRVVLYGYKFYPVLRAEIVDSKAFMNTINLIAKESNSSVEWESCGKFQCLKSKESNTMTTFVVKEKSIALSIYPKELKDDMFKHLTADTPTKNAYAMDSFNRLLSENNFKGFGDGFIDLQAVTDRLIATIKKDIPESNRASFNSCSPIAKDIAKKVNKISFGTTTLSKDSMHMLMIFNMDNNLTESLKSITNKNLFTQRVANPIFDLGVNLNAQGLSSAIMELANYVAAEGEKYGCEEIDAKTLRQGSAMASMSIGMSLGQLSELYLSLNDLEMDSSKGVPSKIGVNALVSAPNPASLIEMLKMLSPELSGLNIPTTGEEVNLLDVLPQPAPPFITELKASMKGKVISLRLGENPKMEQFKPKENTLLWAKVNNKKYYKLISMVMEQNQNKMFVPMQNSSPEDNADYAAMQKELAKNNKRALKLMKALYDLDVESTQSIYIDNRGLAIEFTQDSTK